MLDIFDCPAPDDALIREGYFSFFKLFSEDCKENFYKTRQLNRFYFDLKESGKEKSIRPYAEALAIDLKSVKLFKDDSVSFSVILDDADNFIKRTESDAFTFKTENRIFFLYGYDRLCHLAEEFIFDDAKKNELEALVDKLRENYYRVLTDLKLEHNDFLKIYRTAFEFDISRPESMFRHLSSGFALTANGFDGANELMSSMEKGALYDILNTEEEKMNLQIYYHVVDILNEYEIGSGSLSGLSDEFMDNTRFNLLLAGFYGALENKDYCYIGDMIDSFKTAANNIRFKDENDFMYHMRVSDSIYSELRYFDKFYAACFASCVYSSMFIKYFKDNPLTPQYCDLGMKMLKESVKNNIEDTVQAIKENKDYKDILKINGIDISDVNKDCASITRFADYHIKQLEKSRLKITEKETAPDFDL